MHQLVGLEQGPRPHRGLTPSGFHLPGKIHHNLRMDWENIGSAAISGLQGAGPVYVESWMGQGLRMQDIAFAVT